MKLITADEKIESNHYELKNFKIADDPSKIMMIFSHNFYKRPAVSAFREIFANAVDEHIKHNIKRPVTIFIGKKDNPFPEFDYYVSIRDYAKGLSREDVDRIYTTFFFSTKDTSNTQWGAFGLGSKSPFAVHTEFIVRSYHNGTMTEYLMLRSDSDLRYIVLREEPTDESGLEVVFPISDEYRDFIPEVLILLNPEIPFELKTDSSDIVRNYKQYMIGVTYYDQNNKLLITSGATEGSKVKIYYSFQLRKGRYSFDAVHYPEIGTLKLTPSRDEIIEDDNYKQLVEQIQKIYNMTFKDIDLLHRYANSYSESRDFYFIVVDPNEISVPKLRKLLTTGRTVLYGLVLTEDEFTRFKNQIKKYLQIDPNKVITKILTAKDIKKRFKSVVIGEQISTRKGRTIKKRSLVYRKDGKEYKIMVDADKILDGIIDLYKQGIREFVVNTAFKSAVMVPYSGNGFTITIDYLLAKPGLIKAKITEAIIKDINETIKIKPKVLLVPTDKYPNLLPKTIFERRLSFGRVKLLDNYIEIKDTFPIVVDYATYMSYDIFMYVPKDTSEKFLDLDVFDKVKYCKEKGYNVEIVRKYSTETVNDFSELKTTVQRTLNLINDIEEIQNANREA